MLRSQKSLYSVEGATSPLSRAGEGAGILCYQRLERLDCLEGLDWTLAAGRLIGLVARLLWLPWLRGLVAGALADERQ
jgi:hypothetical protein